MRRIRSLHALVFMVMLLPSACLKKPPEVIRVRFEPSFTYENVKSGGIGIAGVTSDWFDLPGTSATADWIGPWLWVTATEERPDLAIVSSPEIRDSIGRDDYVHLLDTHSRLAEVDSTALAALSQSLSYPRYLAFARIEQDTIRVKRRYTDGYYTRDDEHCSTTDLELTTERTIQVRFQVYDVRREQLVWAGVSRHTDKSLPLSRNVEDSCGSGGLVQALIELAVDLLVEPDPNDTGIKPPNPPKWSKMLNASFKAFARKLPPQSD